MKRLQILIIFLLVLLIPPLLYGFLSSEKKQQPKPRIEKAQDIDLPQIREKGKISVVTDFNSINYFIYKGQPMGFQYELLNELADHLGLELELKASNDVASNLKSLVNGDYDLIASNLTITRERRDLVAFTVPHSQTCQVLVQRAKGRNGNRSGLINSPLELAGKTVYVHENSSYSARLRNIEEETGEEINIVESPSETEQLIKMVANGEIEYTISDENIAQVNKTYYPGIDIETKVSFNQNLAWAVRKGSTELKKEIDAWMSDFRKTAKYAVIYNKYFNSERSAFIVKSDYYYPETGKISGYDKIIRKEAERIGWDWRLIASMIYQESRFNPNITSWAGAFGIMQLMPNTASEFGVGPESSPEAQIKAGISLIQRLDKRFEKEITDPHERAKFVLAAYNIGYGHIRDAINLTVKYGADPTRWDDNVEVFLMKKSDPKYFTDPVVNSGYCQGTQTYAYVKEIMYRYDNYLNMEIGDLAQNLK
jgi:membrane-bound lytic murein transglycosylase F